jgi:hypothetical protein
MSIDIACNGRDISQPTPYASPEAPQWLQSPLEVIHQGHNQSGPDPSDPAAKQ